MKTILPASITTIAQAKEFLANLYNNNEHYHPEDSAHDIVGNPFTPEEADKLDGLMTNIYDLPGNDGRHCEPLIFDPCGYILTLDMEMKDAQLKADILKGIFDEYGNEISYFLESEPNDGRRGHHFSLSFVAKGDLISRYLYQSKEDAEEDIEMLNRKTSIEFNEG